MYSGEVAHMIVVYRDGGALRCSNIKWDGKYLVADDFYLILPEEICEIMEGSA